MSPEGCTVRAALGFALLAAALLAALAGCGTMGAASVSGVASIRSESGAARLGGELPTRLYRSYDPDTADFYMTDLPESVWREGADVSNLSGMIIHVRMFIRPEAGDTPISQDASSAAVRVLVLANGELGIYGGGGFMVAQGESGDEKFGGRMASGTLRLTRATAGFADRLGPSRIDGSFGATRDDQQARLIDRAMRTLIAYTREIEPPEEPGYAIEVIPALINRSIPPASR